MVVALVLVVVGVVEDVGVAAFVVEGVGVAALVPQAATKAKASSVAAPANRALLLAMTQHPCAMERVSNIAATHLVQLFDSLTRPHRKLASSEQHELMQTQGSLLPAGSVVATPFHLPLYRQDDEHGARGLVRGPAGRVGGGQMTGQVISGGGTQGLHRGVTGPVDAFRRYPWCSHSSTSKSVLQYRGYREHAHDPRTCPRHPGVVRVN